MGDSEGIDVPDGFRLTRKTWSDGTGYWTLNHDRGHGVVSGVGGEGEPTQEVVYAGAKRLGGEHNTEGSNVQRSE